MTFILVNRGSLWLQVRLGLECGEPQLSGGKQSGMSALGCGCGEPVRLESRVVARSELGFWNKKLARQHVERRDWWLGTWRTEIIQA